MSLPTADEVRQHLLNQLQPSMLEVLDESSAHAGHAGNLENSPYGTHLRIRVASPLFAGKTRVAQHRLVYDACQDFIQRGLHALAIEVVVS